jgi:hypothetical protein
MDWLLHHKGIMAASGIALLALVMILTVAIDARLRR